ncbi:leucyl aminopeptidase [Maribellus sp. YY47]|uniref:leucyl aminopeptidase family protein n=1 Tax=Maribellus sp. YY47 TaxID=2929486 RepID=UPI00200160E5|nr:leucyl aminopeptidase [Maribellus sp. YY47]MCK3683236.1 leucyl aminopeptidase [Maribellus sp. YY47]
METIEQISATEISEKEREYLSKKLEKGTESSILNYPELTFFGKIKPDENYTEQEAARKAGAKLYNELKDANISAVNLINRCNSPLLKAFLEGLLLASYSFDKYLKEKETFALTEVFVVGDEVSDRDTEDLLNLVRAVFTARDLVNEPNSFLNAPQLSKELEKLSERAGFSLEVFHKQKIEALKMGGLLAVNKGSIDPPTFNILEWKPENAVNKKPIVLVGKGIVFDTGGLSLKPTANSMDYMKTDMAGAAVIATTIYALALNKVPLHVVGLVAATDNRPDGNAYVPGDIITMFDGTTVEVLNTDAEGRLTLADALTYAKKYDPQLVIDYATLTGAADIVAGPHAAVVMGNTSENIEKLKKAGFETYERLIEVPLWDEYAKPLKSKIADMNNLGTREGQSTIAGKFLEHFTSYNWIHIDSAGTPFLKEADAYRPAGGTGFGTRLLYQFLKSML